MIRDPISSSAVLGERGRGRKGRSRTREGEGKKGEEGGRGGHDKGASADPPNLLALGDGKGNNLQLADPRPLGPNVIKRSARDWNGEQNIHRMGGICCLDLNYFLFLPSSFLLKIPSFTFFSFFSVLAESTF